MSISSDSHKKYNSAKDRFLKASLNQFFKREFPTYFGPSIREKIILELLKRIEKVYPSKTRVEPGQIVWNTLDKNTPACSNNVNYVSVILTVTSSQDIEKLSQGEKITQVKKHIIARLCREAFEQGGLLSMRDISLLLAQDLAYTSKIRKKYEQENNTILPHTGSLHDVGTCLSHKKIIVRKVMIEKQDPNYVAKATNHSQNSVDKYLRDYQRVKLVYEKSDDINYIHSVTAIAKHVIKEYIKIINKQRKQKCHMT